MQFHINGTVMQTLAIDLQPGETVYSQTNSMCWMNDQIDMNTNTGGGFLAGIGRMFSALAGRLGLSRVLSPVLVRNLVSFVG